MSKEQEMFVLAEKKVTSWLHKNRKSKEPIAVVLGGTPNGLSFARSLGRRKVPVLLLESYPFLGVYTRYANVVMLPSVEEYEQKWAEFLQKIGTKLTPKGNLFATIDPYVLTIGKYQQLLQEYFNFLIPSYLTVQNIVNKREQYQIVANSQVSMPQTYFPEDMAELSTIVDKVSYPCILKPYISHLASAKLKQKVLFISNKNEMIEKFQYTQQLNVRVMVQELIPGDDDQLFGYLAFWDKGQELVYLTKQKKRQYPLAFGNGSLQVTVDIPEIVKLSRQVLQNMNYQGFVSIEYKKDLRDNSYRLIEINPRTVSGNQLAISAGIDLPWIGYQYLLGNTLVTENKSFRKDVLFINEEWDLLAFLSLKKAGHISLKTWLLSIAKVEARAIWAWDDPSPLLEGFRRFLATKIFSKTSK